MNKYVAIGVVAILVSGVGWWYFSQSNTATSDAVPQVSSIYKNSVLGLTFSIPTSLTVVEKDHYRGNDPRSYLITVANSNSTYYARLWANSSVEFTMGPDDVAPTVATSSVSINGIDATKSLEHYSDTGSTYLTLSFKSGTDWYYFNFPYSSPQDKAYSDKIIQTIQFR